MLWHILVHQIMILHGQLTHSPWVSLQYYYFFIDIFGCVKLAATAYNNQETEMKHLSWMIFSRWCPCFEEFTANNFGIIWVWRQKLVVYNAVKNIHDHRGGIYLCIFFFFEISANFNGFSEILTVLITPTQKQDPFFCVPNAC